MLDFHSDQPPHLVGPVETAVLHLAGADLPVRRISSRASSLEVAAAPIGRLHELLQHLAAQGSPAVYILTGRAFVEGCGEGVPATRIGETLAPTARLRRHLANPPLDRLEQVAVITSPHRPLGKHELLALQAGLTWAAQDAGSHHVVGASPPMPPLGEPQHRQLARWLAELRILLRDAGIWILDPPAIFPDLPDDADEDAPEDEVAPAVPSGYTVDVPDDLVTDPRWRRYRLAQGDVEAHAAVRGPWTVLRAGSLVSTGKPAGLQECLARKRATLQSEGLLRPVHGRRDVLRLVCDLGLPSLCNAGRLVTASNRPASVWALDG